MVNLRYDHEHIAIHLRRWFLRAALAQVTMRGPFIHGQVPHVRVIEPGRAHGVVLTPPYHIIIILSGVAFPLAVRALEINLHIEDDVLLASVFAEHAFALGLASILYTSFWQLER